MAPYENDDDHAVRGLDHAVRELETIEQRYASLFALNPDPICMLDLDGRLVSGNAALERLTGEPLDALLGRSFLHCLAADQRGDAWQHFTRARAGATQTYEVCGSNRDGRTFTLAMTHIPVVVDGAVEGVHAIARDVSQQKASERAHRQVDERYRLLADNVQDLISLHDIEGLFIYASPSSAAMLGLQPAELAGRSVYDLIESDDVELMREAHRTIMQRDGRGPATFRARRIDGTLRWFESTARVIMHEESGEPWRIVAVTRDITERRAVEAQLMQMQKLEALGRLARGVAHDFNNALTVIGGHAELLTSGLADGTEDREHAEHIRGAALRAASLTRQLLTYGRVEERDLRVCDLNAMLLELQPIMATLLSDEVVLSLELAPDLVGVNAEPAALEQTLMNLVVNARDAMPNGGRLTIITQNVQLADDENALLRPGSYVSLTLSDTGSGIPPEIVPHIFEPFFTTKPSSIGTGLGLSMAHTIVEQAGGTIDVESTPGAGAMFRIMLPGVAAPVRAAAEQGAAPSAGLRGTETILVAEDDAGVRALVVATLERYGYRVMAAVDGMQALELFRMYGHLIDMIVTDVNMPELKGPELVRILADAGTNMPVLYISGFTPQSLQLGGLARRRAFLSKPFTPVELGQAVRQLLATPAA
jgi:two-component system, cell cycle sensor histidine kinase and response regulator CckA